MAMDLPTSSHSDDDLTSSYLRQTRDALKAPIASSETLLGLLSVPLDLLNLIDVTTSSFRWSHSNKGSKEQKILMNRYVASFQTVILGQVVVDWYDVLQPTDRHVLESWFCPSRKKNIFGPMIAILAYQSLCKVLSGRAHPTLKKFCLKMLERLSADYSVEEVYKCIYRDGGDSMGALQWENVAKCLVGLPARVANALEGQVDEYPSLQSSSFFLNLTTSLVNLIGFNSQLSSLYKLQSIDPVSQFLSKLLTTQSLPIDQFVSILCQRIPIPTSPSPFTEYTKDLIIAQPFSSLTKLASSFLSSNSSYRSKTRIAALLEVIFGFEEKELLLESVFVDVDERILSGVKLSKRRAIVGVIWAGAMKPGGNMKGLEGLLRRTLAVWGDTKFIKFSLWARHYYITTLLILLIKSFPPSSPPLLQLSTSPIFLGAMTGYLSHPDPAIRRLGMLVAETVSSLTRKADGPLLEFGASIWDGVGEGKEACRELRELKMNVFENEKEEENVNPEEKEININPLQPPPSIAVEVKVSTKDRKAATRKKTKIEILSDSDDSLTGYDSAGSSSSRASSPTPSELDDIATDPTLNTAQKKKPQRPVYLSQLTELLLGTEDPEKIEVALRWGEELIRRKRGFGMELEDEAERLAIVFVGLNDNFDLEEFEERKQGVLNALVVCCPKKTTLVLIEQYFSSQYSLTQRSFILTALAMGARESAALPTIQAPSTSRIDFPSKLLPPAMHKKFVEASSTSDPSRQIQHLASDLGRLALEKGRDEVQKKVPEFVREKQLQVRRFSSRSVSDQVTPSKDMSMQKSFVQPGQEYSALAAEYFIIPFINRFWIHLKDETTKEQRSSRNYVGAGTGMVLSSLSLTKFLATMTVLLHAARHSPAYLNVLAPETLELALNLGIRQISISEDPEATVLIGCLELALTVLDTCKELDGGRTLVTDHARLVMALGEWGEGTWKDAEDGFRRSGEGGIREGRVKQAAAGVAVLVQELVNQWRRLMNV